MYIRTVVRRNRDGTVVRYIQLAENVRNARAKSATPRIIHNFGREPQVDKEALRRLVRSINKFLATGEGLPAAGVSRKGQPGAGSMGAQEATTSALAKAAIFADLNAERLVELSQIATERQLDSQQFLYFEGEPLEHFYVIVEGRLKIFRHSPAGRDFIIGFRGPGDIIGNVDLSSRKLHPFSAQAAIDSRVLALQKDQFLSFLSGRPDLGFDMLRKMLLSFGQRFTSAVGRLTDLVAERADHRLADTLFGLSLEFGPTVPFTRQEIAEMAGTTTETATRFVNRLREMGVVHPLRRKIVIRDQGKLASLTGEPPSATK